MSTYGAMAKILAIDDDLAVLNSIGLLLKTEGHDVILERDSEKAVKLVRSETYDLIITDIRMEPVDGMELVKLAKRYQPKTPIIIVSAITSEETTKLGYSLGCTSYIKKPFKIKEVLDAVYNALGEGENHASN
jgi:two-component system response regulator PilR (NtrC family)